MECTQTPHIMPWCLLLVIHPNGQVTIVMWANDGSSMTTPVPTTVVCHQILCQLKAEAFGVCKGTWATVVLHEYDGIGYSYIEQKGVDALIW